MTLYRFVQDPLPALEAPVLITAFEGWVDAGGAASAAGAHIADGAEPFAVFDVDRLIDYRARRPVLDIVDGTLTEMQWPELLARRVRGPGRDLIVLTGPEPDYRWRELGASVLDMALRAGIVESISVGAIPAAVAHTRPTPVLATAHSRDKIAPEDPRPEGFLRVPAAALSAVEMALAEHGVPTRGFYAQVPHYVGATYTPAVIAIVERLGRHLGVTFSTGSLPEEAVRLRAELDEMLEDREDVKEYVQRLESLQPDDKLPTGEEIASEIERFLREGRGEAGPFDR